MIKPVLAFWFASVAMYAATINPPIPVTGSGSYSVTFLNVGQQNLSLSGTNGTDTLSLSISGSDLVTSPPSDFLVFGSGTVMLDGTTYTSFNVEVGNGGGQVTITGTTGPIVVPLIGYIVNTGFDSFTGNPPQADFDRGTFNVVSSPTPEPGTVLLFGCGALFLVARKRAARTRG